MSSPGAGDRGKSAPTELGVAGQYCSLSKILMVVANATFQRSRKLEPDQYRATDVTRLRLLFHVQLQRDMVAQPIAARPLRTKPTRLALSARPPAPSLCCANACARTRMRWRGSCWFSTSSSLSSRTSRGGGPSSPAWIVQHSSNKPPTWSGRMARWPHCGPSLRQAPTPSWR